MNIYFWGFEENKKMPNKPNWTNPNYIKHPTNTRTDSKYKRGCIKQMCRKFHYTICINKKRIFYNCPSLEYAEKTSLLFIPTDSDEIVAE